MSTRLLVRAAAIVALTVPLAGFSPENTECIAPANPGGGWDFTCRTVAKLLQDEGLVSSPMQTINMTGAVGAVAYANVAQNRASDENLIVATSTVGITQIAQDKYPSDVDTMRWLAMLGADVGVVMVQKDSEIESLQDLLDALSEDPTSMAAAGSSAIGGWDHLRLLILAQEAGMETDALKSIRWVEFSGGADAVTQLLGGHVQLVLTDVGEIGGFIESGDVKALAVMSDERIEAFPDIPTAIEEGVDATGYNWRGFYVGGDVGDEAYDGWTDIMQQLYESEGWQAEAKAAGLTPIWRGGAEFEEFVRSEEARMNELSRAIGVIQ